MKSDPLRYFLRLYLNLLLTISFVFFFTPEGFSQQSFSLETSPKKAVVSGLSVSGILAAAILSKAGYEVHAYEKREEYVREIIWASRQTLIDQLATVDQKLAERFLYEIAQSNIPRVLDTVDGTQQRLDPVPVKSPNAKPGFVHSSEVLSMPPVVMSQSKVFEAFMRSFLETLPNVYIHTEEFEIGEKNSEGNYTLKSGEVFDLIVIAEGANSKTRADLGIEAIKVGQNRLQAAARIYYAYPDTLQLRWEKVNGKDMRSQTLTLEQANAIWATTDLAIERITPDKSFGDSRSEAYENERSRLIGLEIKRVVARNLNVPLIDLLNSKITSPIGTEKLRTFEYQSHLSSKATAGRNVILFGDAVGNGHWAGAGGLETAVSNHLRQFKALLYNIENGLGKEPALKRYDRAVTENSIEWLKLSTPNVDPQWRSHSATVIEATGKAVCKSFMLNALKVGI